VRIDDMRHDPNVRDRFNVHIGLSEVDFWGSPETKAERTDQPIKL
jgi:hypothetical protein